MSSAASTAPICMLTLAPIRRYRDEAPTHHACMSTVSASRLKPLPGAARHRRAPGRPRVRAPVGTHRSVRYPARGGRRETSPGGTPHVDALATRPDPRGRPHRLHTCGRIQPGRDRRAERCRAERCRAKRRRPEHARRVGVAGGVLTHGSFAINAPGPPAGPASSCRCYVLALRRSPRAARRARE